MPNKIQRRNFSKQFKEQAVILTATSEKPINTVAKELALCPSMLKRWRKELTRNNSLVQSQQQQKHQEYKASFCDEIQELKQKLIAVQTERDVLKQALKTLL